MLNLNIKKKNRKQNAEMFIELFVKLHWLLFIYYILFGILGYVKGV